MSSLRLISNRSAPRPSGAGHPCLQAFQRELDYVIRTLRRLGVPANDVEDLTHEVFMVLFQSWDKYDSTRPLRPYLFGIAFRIVGNYLRKRKREVLFAVVEAGAVGPFPDQALEVHQMRALVLSALKRVPLPRRAVLIMHDIDSLPMAEIAESLSIYRFTGYSRLRKARQEFAQAVSSLIGGSEP
jgi:RNA polymerase sigma-70 factor, ECF subfamily